MTTYPDDVVEKALDAGSPEWRMKDKVGQFLARTQMRHALAAAEAAMWRPIGLEHKDGHRYLVAGNNDGLIWRTIGHWVPAEGEWCDDADVLLQTPLMCRPLPTPPAASTGRG